MRKWLVVLGFDEHEDAREFADLVCESGVVAGLTTTDDWQSRYASVELGPYREDGEDR